MKFSIRLLFVCFITIIISSLSCGKGGSTTPTDPCNGVTISVTGTVTNPTVIGASNGTITANATGASGFTYSINGSTFQSSNVFSGLAAGSYTVTAKSSAGCIGSSSFSIIAPPNPCAGVSITVSGTSVNPTSTTINNGTINATATGSSGFTFSVNGGAFQTSGTFANLAAGAYTVTAKDLNGCTGATSFTLTAPNPCTGITIVVAGTTTNPTTAASNNGSIVASASGSSGFTFSLNSGSFQASGTFTGLGEGNHTITAKDLNGCTASTVFTLTAPNPCAGITITVSTAITNNTPCETGNTGSITVTAAGGTGPYTYSRNGTTFQGSNIFNTLSAASYTITAKDANGCIGTTTSTVANAPAGPLFLAVKSVLQANCSSCHNSTVQNGGMNWDVDCNIVQNKDRVRIRAVDGNPSPMPPTGLISASDRQKITDWINAGGKFSN